MSDSIRTDIFRKDQAKAQIELQNDKEMKNLKEKHKNDLERVIEGNVATKADLERAYDISISSLRDEHDRKLTETRNNNSKLIEEEKARGEEEVERVRSRYQEQIARYKENSEKQLNDAKVKTENTLDNMRKMRGKA